MEDVVVEVNNISMKYRLTTEKIDSFKYFLIKSIKKQVKYETFHALQDITFTVNKGEVLGIVGMNGAGKSTLLKIISGVLKPSTGEVIKRGTIAPLLELGAGFNGELSGAENIYLNGLLLGYSKKFIKEKYDEIVEFAELDKFIHTPLKNYSSGMKSRLGFAIATVVQPEILIVDEVLSVGDFKFREKSEARIKELMSGGTTVLFVSHNMKQVETLCDRVLWLKEGKIHKIGPASDVVQAFKNQ